MMLRSLVATVTAAAVLVAWGMVFWGFLANPAGAFRELPDEAVITRALQQNDVPTGTYFKPWPRNTPETFSRFVAQHQSGPFYRLSYVREGVDPNSPVKLLIGTLHYLSVAAVAVVIVVLAGQPSFLRRVTIVVLAGALGSIFVTLGDRVWFHMPWDHVRAALLYELVSWTLLALVVAALVPSAARTELSR
jgi:hypothetical protein